MAHIVARHGFLPTYFTYSRHDIYLFYNRSISSGEFPETEALLRVLTACCLNPFSLGLRRFNDRSKEFLFGQRPVKKLPFLNERVIPLNTESFLSYQKMKEMAT